MTPRIITAAQQGLTFPTAGSQGVLGPEHYVTGHYDAGPKDRNLADAKSRVKTYHAEHARRYNSNGIGYHYMITRAGVILCLRPTNLKGTHVAMHNSNNIGVVMCGTTGDKPSIRQRRAFKWLLKNAHTTAMPKAHRTDLSLRNAIVRGHRRWPDNATLCPGDFIRMYESRGQYR